MWTLRQEQVDAFRPKFIAKFEDDMVQHLREFAPKQWAVLREPRVRQIIKAGSKRANSYSFTNRGPVRFFLELMFMFGCQFDTDPQHPWALGVLKDSRVADQMVRADQLYRAMNEYLEVVSGNENRFLLEAMRRFSRSELEDFVKTREDSVAGIIESLQAIHPEKCNYLGKALLGTVIQSGFRVARDYQFASERGMVLMAVFSFDLGHGFAKDPLYPWVETGLKGEPGHAENERVEDLHSKWKLELESLLGGETRKGTP